MGVGERRGRGQGRRDGRRRSARLAHGRASEGAPGHGNACAGRDVVIVDDIVTTGATMRACADALRDAGARVVCGLALAATPRYGTSAG
ncbi:ComF family protein [Bifidobacterium santillanense]|uniref:ComF family protein n=1 Tax=Bifidobacterium santillanense TaxID=2809028 RepID=UPI0030B80824